MESDVIQIITERLQPYLTAEGVCAYPTYRLIKYVAYLKDYFLAIRYEFVDNFYEIKIEERKNNQIGEIVLLSQSKRYHKDLKRRLAKDKLEKKKLSSHMICLCQIIQEQLDEHRNLDDFQEKYVADMKFDGIFL